MFVQRQGLVVWLYSLKQAKMLRRFGNVHYVSKKLKYVVLYCNQDEVETIMEKLKSFSFVKKVEPSYKPFLRMWSMKTLHLIKQRNMIIKWVYKKVRASLVAPSAIIYFSVKKNPADINLQGPSISLFRIEGKGRGETGGRTYGET